MNTVENYIYRVYIEKSFSKAAKLLHISQPSLSGAIAHKERELGFRIFDRSTKPISLTLQGGIYITMLTEFMESESNMRLKIDRLVNKEASILCVGGSFSSAHFLMTHICREFSRKHPEAQVKLDIGSFRGNSLLYERYSIFEKLDKDELDLIFCYGYDEEKYIGYPIYRERLIAAVPCNMTAEALLPYAVTREELLCESYGLKKEIRSANLFENTPFLEFDESDDKSKHMAALLGKYMKSPYKPANAIHDTVHYSLARAGVGAVFTTDCSVALHGDNSDRLNYFLFDKISSERSIYLVMKKGNAQNRKAEDFIAVAKEVLSKKPLSIQG